MAMPELTLNPKERAYLERLKRMFPRQDGGQAALEARLRDANLKQETAVRSGAHVTPAALEEYTARVRKMYGARPVQVQAEQLVLPNVTETKAPPNDDEKEALSAQAVAAEADAANIWGEKTILEMEFPRDVCVVAVTPLEQAEAGILNWEYVENPDVPPDHPERIVGCRVRYTRAQMELAMALVRALQADS